jgi:hypothetical protein
MAHPASTINVFALLQRIIRSSFECLSDASPRTAVLLTSSCRLVQELRGFACQACQALLGRFN